MQAIFIRHAAAEGSGAGGDAARKLTDKGREQAKTAAGALTALGIELEALLTSPLVRAVESAEITAAVHGCPVEPVEGLAPPIDAAAIAARLAELAASGAAAVGLVGNDPRLNISLSKAGAAAVTLPAEGSEERPELVWLMRREQLALLTDRGENT